MATYENIGAPTLPVIAKTPPPEGNQCVPFTLTLTSQLYQLARTYQINTGRTMSQVRTITIDNSQNPKPLIVTHGLANQSTIIPAAGGGIIPTTSSAGGYFFSIATADAPSGDVPIGVLLSNYEIPPALYGTQVVTVTTEVPTGIIVMWSGDPTQTPPEWGLCDGTVYQRSDRSGTIKAPDLRGRFIIGAADDTNAGEAFPMGAMGGSASITQNNLPNVTLVGTATAHLEQTNLTVTANTPATAIQSGQYGTGVGLNLFGLGGGYTAVANIDYNSDLFVPQMSVSFSQAYLPKTNVTFDKQTVPLGGQGTPFYPPYFALCYIMKL